MAEENNKVSRTLTFEKCFVDDGCKQNKDFDNPQGMPTNIPCNTCGAEEFSGVYHNSNKETVSENGAGTENKLQPQATFEQQLKWLINKCCKENASNTPDFILAEYLDNCLDIFNDAVIRRELWYGRKVF